MSRFIIYIKKMEVLLNMREIDLLESGPSPRLPAKLNQLHSAVLDRLRCH